MPAAHNVPGSAMPGEKSPPSKKVGTAPAAQTATPSAGVAKTAASEADIASLRQAAAAIDAQIAALLHERAALVQTAVARHATIDADLDSVVKRHAGALPERSLRTVFQEVHSACRALARSPRVAFLGPLYSYSHLAALEYFGSGVEYVPVGSISAVFEEVHQGQSDRGLAPIENSTDGRIADSLDMFARLPVQMTAMVEMRIHHTLLGVCQRSEVKEVYSKPQALSQCRNWLAKHLPAARTIEVTSTTTAAQLAKEKPGAAAIASRQAGVQYGLSELAADIEDQTGNLTRFAVIGGPPTKRSGRDCTAVFFQVEHRPGALAEAMSIFKRAAVNLTWIESFPIPNSERAYLFFVELEGHATDARPRRALRALAKRALRLEILGSYPKPKLIE